MNRIVRIAARVETAAALAASACILALMAIVTADVLLRYFFNSPFVWTRDVVGLYLMPAAFFLILSDGFRDGAMVRVEILHDLFPPRLRNLSDALCNATAVLAFVLIGYGGFWQAWEAWTRDEIVAGSIPWRTWPGYLLVGAGSLLLTCRLVATSIRKLLSPSDTAEGGAAESGTIAAEQVAE